MASYIQTVWFFLFLLFPIVLFMKKHSSKRHNKHLPPCPPKLPIVGNLHQLGKLPHQSLWRLSKKYGPVMLLRIGSIPTVVISSPETAKEILNTHDLDCSRPRLTGSARLSYNYNDVALSPYGHNWREMKKIFVLELLSPNRVRSFRDIREEEVSRMIESISQSCSGSNFVDLSEKTKSLLANIIFRASFAKTSFLEEGFEKDKFQEMVFETHAMLGSFFASDYFPYFGWIFDRLSGLHGRLEKIFREMDVLYQKIIDDHLDANREKQEKIVDVMLNSLRDQAGSEGFQLTQKVKVKGMLLNIFVGGIHTTAAVICWAMAELARKPSLMKKAQEEIRNAVEKKGKVSETDIDELPYLKMVIKETLRLHPAGPLLIPRKVMSAFNVGGYDICPNDLIQVNVWAIGRDPKYWENPEEFCPERFIDNPRDFKGHHFEFLPFGAGRRACPGVHMGVAAIELALANLLYYFDWKLPNGVKEEDIDMEEEINGVTLDKKSALILVPVKYQW